MKLLGPFYQEFVTRGLNKQGGSSKKTYIYSA